MATQPHHRYTLAEYADIDSAADLRCEYLDGAIYAMAGGSPDHAQIESNLTRHLGNALAGGPCRVWGSTMRVQAAALRTYPDLSVICGPPEFATEPEDDEPVIMDNGSIRSFNTEVFRIPTFVRKQMD